MKIHNVEDNFENMVSRATTRDMERVKRVMCVLGTKWVQDKLNIFKVRRTVLKDVLEALSLWVMNSLLQPSHDLYWHKERLFLLEGTLCTSKINVGKVMEREILSCTRRTKGGLCFPNLMKLKRNNH